MVARVNGEERARCDLRRLGYSWQELAAHAGRNTLLRPGDLLVCSTRRRAAARGSEPGDMVELELEGIGVLRNAVAPPASAKYPLRRMFHAPCGVTFARMQALRDPSAITDRQRQVIELIAQGLSNDELSHELGISPRTAKAHCDVLRQKLGVPRRRQIPLAYRLLTGEDPLAKSLELARADNGG